MGNIGAGASGGIHVGVADIGVSGGGTSLLLTPLFFLRDFLDFSGDDSLFDRDLDDLDLTGDEELLDLDIESLFE